MDHTSRRTFLAGGSAALAASSLPASGKVPSLPHGITFASDMSPPPKVLLSTGAVWHSHWKVRLPDGRMLTGPNPVTFQMGIGQGGGWLLCYCCFDSAHVDREAGPVRLDAIA